MNSSKSINPFKSSSNNFMPTSFSGRHLAQYSPQQAQILYSSPQIVSKNINPTYSMNPYTDNNNRLRNNNRYNLPENVDPPKFNFINLPNQIKSQVNSTRNSFNNNINFPNRFSLNDDEKK